MNELDLKKQIVRQAHLLGLSDIRFTGAGGSLSHLNGEPVALQSFLPGARCLIVLFAAYPAASVAPAGMMPLSGYYIASHAAYHAARTLTEYIQELGASAAHLPSLPARAAALRTGGFLGDNGFYFHAQFGSLVCIQTILTDLDLPLDTAEVDRTCLHCGLCAGGCPSGAVGHPENCLRRHINSEVPEHLRDDVYQLLGCEKCQTACPLNHPEPGEPHLFSLEALLDGSAMPELKELVGPKMARPMRVKSQAALYAAATGQHQFAPQLDALAQSGIEPAATHAKWALKRLQSEEPL